MNAISYINGDTEVTDFPTCSARPLAAFVQRCNDVLAGSDGYLSPEDSVLVLDLGWLTVGTAQVSHTVIHAWVAELLTNPTWGVVNYVESDAVEAIRDIAQLHRKVASGDAAPIAAWVAADRSIDTALNPAVLYAGAGGATPQFRHRHAPPAFHQSLPGHDAGQPPPVPAAEVTAGARPRSPSPLAVPPASCRWVRRPRAT
jgi:hypothetical protein